MANWADVDNIETYEDAVQTVLQGINMRVDPRKVLWCNYSALALERDELDEKVVKATKKLGKEIGDDLIPNQLWYVGIPRFKLIRRGVAHLSCEIDLYYVACDTTDKDHYGWYGKLIPKADRFDVPLCLITPLIDALSQGQMETSDAHVVERTPGHSIYDFMGREWRIPDAFLGFVWALKEKGRDFEGLLDPLSSLLMDEFTKELPSSEMPKLTGGGYDDVLSALTNLGTSKANAKAATDYVMAKYPNVSLEDKIRQALSYLGS